MIFVLCVYTPIVLCAGIAWGYSRGKRDGHKSGMVAGNLEGRAQMAHEQTEAKRQREETERRAQEFDAQRKPSPRTPSGRAR